MPLVTVPVPGMMLPDVGLREELAGCAGRAPRRLAAAQAAVPATPDGAQNGW